MGQPWLTEPDREDFEAHGLPCAIRRVKKMGHLCGYVGVPEGHPLYGVAYSEAVPLFVERLIPAGLSDSERLAKAVELAGNKWSHNVTPESVLEAHGGITFSDHGKGDYLPEGPYWFGFDCAHSGDHVPSIDAYPRHGDVYRDIEYVREQCRQLAKQIAEIGS